LQEAKSDFDRMMSYIDAAQKKWDSETREVFTNDQINQMWAALATLGDQVLAARNQE
jgi:hypothetical protein